MKTLIVYYSRTGTTKKVAESIAKILDADLEELVDKKDRSGAWGYAVSARDAMACKPADIEKTKKDAAKYDLVILGTPVWAHKMCPAIRTYIQQNNEKMKQVALFSTMGGSGDEKVFAEMEELCAKRPSAKLTLLTKWVAMGGYEDKLKNFVSLLGVKK